MQLLREAGLPDGVVNVVYGDGAEIGAVALDAPRPRGRALHRLDGTFQHIWRTVGANVANYRNYPRVVGETGGKDFILAHPHRRRWTRSPSPCVRGAYEYQGQKCSAASRLYAPRSLWPALRERLVELTESVVVGDPTEPETYVGAVINARQHAQARGGAGAGPAPRASSSSAATPTTRPAGSSTRPCSRSPTRTSPFITQELFAPVLTTFVYDDADWDRRCASSTSRRRTGSPVPSSPRTTARSAQADDALRYTAGNFYVNDKPTGSVVGQQPFGGARASGTNDKAGTVWNMIRFASPRSIKRNHLPATRLPLPAPRGLTQHARAWLADAARLLTGRSKYSPLS